MALPLSTIYTLSKLLYTLKYKKARGLMDIKIDMKEELRFPPFPYSRRLLLGLGKYSQLQTSC
jgi:hypothetical protein